MRYPQLLLCAALMMAAFWTGCWGGQESIMIGPPPPPAVVETEEEEQIPIDPFYRLLVEPEEDPRRRPKFIAKNKAKTCPSLTVETFAGQRGKVHPGTAGNVTLVVFWCMDYTFTRAAVRHVGDLAQKYERHGVRARGIVEKTKVAKYAPGFIRDQGMDESAYCFLDDFSALRRMGKAARESGVKELPCFFIVDRNRRVRFFKRGFSYVSSAVTEEYQDRLTPGEEIIESAAPGESIEDYLQQLLDEQ